MFRETAILTISLITHLVCKTCCDSISRIKSNIVPNTTVVYGVFPGHKNNVILRFF